MPATGERQALVLIHGIGEQRPMSTLRRFVDVAWRRNVEIHDHTSRSGIWSKPDSVSDSFELRTYTTSRNKQGVRTDFFEFYWAHLMEGHQYRHLIGWARELLFRRPGRVPRALRVAYWLLWVITLLVVAGLLFAWSNPVQVDSKLLPYVLPVLSALVGGFVLYRVGDAARYLRPVPENIQRRHQVREAGVRLLEALHERKDASGEPLYGRIIVAGHSLGSVIAYDILTHLWPRRLAAAELPAVIDTPTLETVTKMVAHRAEVDVDAYREAQARYGRELLAAGLDWRVSDLVTMGSPLAHAPMLLARDADDLAERIAERELPSCPPATELVGGKERFTFSPSGRAPYTIPHHAAVFAPTRWTNLYFPSSMILRGDIVGGPLAPVFGDGIRDIPVETRRWGGWLSHTHYWTWNGTDQTPPPHVQALWDALRLNDAAYLPQRTPCPGCGEPVFSDWPAGWAGHAVKCTAVSGSAAERRKRYKRRYIDPRATGSTRD